MKRILLQRTWLVLLFNVALLFLLNISSVLRAQEYQGRAKTRVFMLLVFDTNAEGIVGKGIRADESRVKAQFEDYLELQEYAHPFNLREQLEVTHSCDLTYAFLDGDDATPENVFMKASEYSNAAGPDDIVFVYMQCGGWEFFDSFKLNPLTDDSDERNAAIFRSQIASVITQNHHRLDVFVTNDPALGVDLLIPLASSISMIEDSYLAKFICSAKGFFNVNSTKQSTEEAVFEGNETIHSDSEHSLYSESGSIFAEEFWAHASFDVSDSSISSQKFYQDLKNWVEIRLSGFKDDVESHLSNLKDDYKNMSIVSNEYKEKVEFNTMTVTWFNRKENECASPECTSDDRQKEAVPACGPISFCN